VSGGNYHGAEPEHQLLYKLLAVARPNGHLRLLLSTF
jgi:hypothetical protein